MPSITAQLMARPGPVPPKPRLQELAGAIEASESVGKDCEVDADSIIGNGYNQCPAVFPIHPD